MGNPTVKFTTYSINSSASWATTNVSGHAANSTSSPFVEIKSDLDPRSTIFSNGDYSVSDYDLIRTVTAAATINSSGNTVGTHEDTVYTTRETLGTFTLSGGQFELCEFDTGAKGSSVEDHFSKSGVGHNYVAFANTGDGDGLLHTSTGTVIGSASVVHGPPTAYEGTPPYANIEYDVSHTSTPLQAIAGGGPREAEGYAGIYIGSSGTTEVLSGGESQDPKVYLYWWTISNA